MTELARIPLPLLGPTAYLLVTNDRPIHYLMFRVVATGNLAPGMSRAFFVACRGITDELQRRAATHPDRGGTPSALFPEARTHDDWHGQFLWEFWWGPDVSTWDVPGLLQALGGVETLQTLILEGMTEYGADC